MTATVSAAYSALAYAAAPDRAARPTAAAPVEGDHAVVAGQVRHLRLPHPRAHDRPGGQQHHGGRPGPVHGEADRGAASHHDVLAHRTGPGRPRHGRTSNTLLNGVDAASRKPRKPAATVTSRIRAGPAWVPSAAPDRLRQRCRGAQQGREAVVGAPHRVEVVLDVVARGRLDEQPDPVGGEGLVHPLRRAHRVAHVVQGVEGGHQVVAGAAERGCRGHLELDPVLHPGRGGPLDGGADRGRVVVGADEARGREGLGHEHGRGAVAAADVGDGRTRGELVDQRRRRRAATRRRGWRCTRAGRTARSRRARRCCGRASPPRHRRGPRRGCGRSHGWCRARSGRSRAGRPGCSRRSGRSRAPGAGRRCRRRARR